jgi:GTP cyclohydrolase-4
MTVPDVQNLRSPHDYELTRVGVTGVKKPLEVHRPDRDEAVVLTATFDACVDLPAEQRGTHMSRNVEAINEAIDEGVRGGTEGVEDLAAALAEDLLARHEYATIAEVEIAADYFRERSTPEGADSLEEVGLSASAVAERGEGTRKTVGVTVTGMTACPCAMEGTRAILVEEGRDPGEAPSVTHNQRNTTTLAVETDASDGEVEADDLADIVEESLSAPTFEYLKRGDEAELVLEAHRHPRFVEDVVREGLERVKKRYEHLPGGAVVRVRSQAEESIHKHDAFAERVTTLGDLRD